MLKFCEKTTTGNVPFLMEESSSVRVQRANFLSGLDAMMTLMRRMKEDTGKSLFNVFTKIQKTYGNMAMLFNKNSSGSCRRMKEDRSSFSGRVSPFSGERRRRTVMKVFGGTEFFKNEITSFRQSRDQSVRCG